MKYWRVSDNIKVCDYIIFEVIPSDWVTALLRTISEDTSVQFSRSVMSNSLRPHELQHTRPPCPSPTPRIHSNPHPLSRWCHPTISSSAVPFSSCLQSSPASGSFNELSLCTRWPNYWSFNFSISPSNEYSGLISFRIDWFDLLAVHETQKCSPTPQFKSIKSQLSLFLNPESL